MKVKCIYIAVFLLILGTLMSQIKVIPSWKNIQTILVASVFILAIITGSQYLFKLWIGKNKEKRISLTQLLIRTGIVIAIFPLALLIVMPSFSKPEMVYEVTRVNKTIYVYHETCFPPDNACECETYGSLVYTKNKYLPIMHLVLKTDFYVEDVQLYNKEFIVKASDICAKDVGKSKRTNI